MRQPRAQQAVVAVAVVLIGVTAWSMHRAGLAVRQQQQDTHWQQKLVRAAELREMHAAVPDTEPMVLVGHTGPVNRVAFTPRGPLIVTGSTDRTVRLWDALTGEFIAILGSFDHAVEDVAVSPDGRLVAAADRRGLTLWDAAGTRVGSATYDGISRIAFINDERLLVQLPAKRVTLDTLTLDTLDTAEIGVARRTSIPRAYSPDGKRVACGGRDGLIEVWALEHGRRVARIDTRAHRVGALAYSHDGTMLAGASIADPTVLVWDARPLAEREAVRRRRAALRRDLLPRIRDLVTQTGDTRQVIATLRQDATLGPEARLIATQVAMTLR